MHGKARVLSWGIVGLMASVLAAGCGGGSNAASSSSSSAKTSASAPAASAAASAPASSGKLIPVKVGYGATGASYGDLFVAEDLGLFKKYGLNVQLVYTHGSTGIPALISGSVDIAANGGEVVMKNVAAGVKNLTIFGQEVPRGYLEIWVQPGIKSAKDLVGKNFSATQPGALGDVLTRVWLRDQGVDPSKVHIVYLNTLANLVAGMKSKKTAATMILPPLGEQLKAAGDVKLGDLRSMKFASHMDISTTPYIKAHPQVITDFLKATAEATADLKTEPNVVLPILAKYTKTTNPAWNKYGYDFFKPLWTVDPKVDLSVLTSTQKILNDPKINKVNVASIVDNSFATQLETSGFIKSLPGQ